MIQNIITKIESGSYPKNTFSVRIDSLFFTLNSGFNFQESNDLKKFFDKSFPEIFTNNTPFNSDLFLKIFPNNPYQCKCLLAILCYLVDSSGDSLFSIKQGQKTVLTLKNSFSNIIFMELPEIHTENVITHVEELITIDDDSDMLESFIKNNTIKEIVYKLSSIKPKNIYSTENLNLAKKSKKTLSEFIKKHYSIQNLIN